MEKNILIKLNDEPKEYLTVKKTTNIKSIKAFLKKYNYDLIYFYINDDTETKVFDTNRYDMLILESVWNKMKNPVICLSTKTGFMSLPPDMKRMIIEEVEPLQVLELCKTVKCNWKKLLDVNYDFVTQGFAVGKTDEEKFRYLAERVSKNIGVEQPEIIFFHENGIPYGKKRFLERSEEWEYEEEELEDLRKEMIYVKTKLENTSGIEWVKQDDNNMWIKVKNPNFLPTMFEIPTESGRQKVLRGNEHYDYPETRKDIVKIENEGEYPDEVLIDFSSIDLLLGKLLDGKEKTKEYIDSFAKEYMLDWNLWNVIPEYITYSMMKDEYSRTEGEIFSTVIKMEGSFRDNLEKLYGYNFEPRVPDFF